MARSLCGVTVILAVVALIIVQVEQKEFSFDEENNKPSQDLEELLETNLADKENVKAEERELSFDEEGDAMKSDEPFQEHEELLETNLADNEIDKRQTRPYSPLKLCPRPSSTRCCGGYLIDYPAKKTCCRGRIVLRRLYRYLCGSKMSNTCGSFLYDRKRHRCCYRHLIPIRSKCRRRRCGRQRYVTYTQQCCNGRVISKSTPCIIIVRGKK